MCRLSRLLAIAAFAFLLDAPPYARTRDLSFEDRIRAQEAIERVHYAHQIGKTKSFEDAVPRAYGTESGAVQRVTAACP